jgi:hypothetical protein
MGFYDGSGSKSKYGADVAESQGQSIIATLQIQAVSRVWVFVERERERERREKEMAWSATMIGALLGLGTQMYSNALRKLPYMRRKSPFYFPNSFHFLFYSSIHPSRQTNKHFD